MQELMRKHRRVILGFILVVICVPFIFFFGIFFVKLVIIFFFGHSFRI